MSNVAINISSEFTGKPAFAKAGKSVSLLEKQVSKLGKQFLGLFAAQKIASFAKTSVKAFGEDEAAAVRLGKVLDNLGLSFANVGIADFIDSLTMASGVSDNELRESFQALITTTGSLTASQKLLTQSIDISRGSGVAMTQVAQDLALAYVGNTKGLKKYNLGLTQAELKAASFTQVQKLLNEQFSGSSSAYLATYAGKMAVLTNASGEAKEIIGGGLVDALLELKGEKSVNQLAKDMQNAATFAADVIGGIAGIAAAIKGLPKIGNANALLQLMTLGKYGELKGAIEGFAVENRRKKSAALAPASANMHLSELSTASNQVKADKAEREAKRRADALAKAQKAALKLEKDKLALKRVAGMQDMQQIQLVAALQGNLSKEERNRAELQLAILTGNTEEAKRLAIEVAKSIDSTGALAKLIRELPEASNPFKSWDKYLDALEERIKKINLNPPTPAPAPTPAPTTTPQLPATNVPPSDYSGFRQNPNMPGTAGSGSQFGPSTPWAMQVQLNVDGKEMAKVLLDQSMSAGQVAYLDRRTGGF